MSHNFWEFLAKFWFYKPKMVNAPEGLNQVILRKVRIFLCLCLFAKNDCLLPKTTVCLAKIIFCKKRLFLAKKHCWKRFPKTIFCCQKWRFVSQKRSFVKNDLFCQKTLPKTIDFCQKCCQKDHFFPKNVAKNDRFLVPKMIICSSLLNS